MEYKRIKFKVESFNKDTGEFEGVASAFRKTPDKVKDIIHRGSFTKTIQENQGTVPLTYPPHDIMSAVGPALIAEGEQGLKVKGTILRGIQKGEEAYLLMKCDPPVITTLSIGYDVIKSEVKAGIRHITEIKLYEIALVPGCIAADDQAVITAVKIDNLKADDPESLNRRVRMIEEAYWQATKPANPLSERANDYWIKEIFDDHIIVDKAGTLWQIAYTEQDDTITFDFENAVEVEQVYQPKSILALLERKAGTEPPPGTPDHYSDPEAAELKAALAGLEAAMQGFDETKAIAALDEVLK